MRVDFRLFSLDVGPNGTTSRVNTLSSYAIRVSDPTDVPGF